MKRFLVLIIAVATSCLGLGLASATGTAVASGAPNPGGLPVRVGLPHAGLPIIALNWSGYAASTHKQFNYVHAEFAQPSITCDGKPSQWTSNWVGLDGFTDETVEQDGTFAWCAGTAHMTPRYVAWYEMYPSGSVGVFWVQPGNLIDASVRFASGKFSLTVSDLSTNKSATTSASCNTCLRDSAEWIIERPALCNDSFTKCFLTALANFHTTTMQSAVAALAGGPAKGLSSFAPSQIFMVQPTKNGGFYSLDNPGAVDASTQSFPVQFLRHGTTVPIQLATKH